MGRILQLANPVKIIGMRGLLIGQYWKNTAFNNFIYRVLDISFMRDLALFNSSFHPSNL